MSYDISNDYAREWVYNQHGNAVRGIFLPLAFIDICDGNLHDAILFAQIMYWHQADIHGRQRLRVRKNNQLWLAKNHSDWYAECRMPKATARKCLQRLADRGLIIYDSHRVFAGNRTPHMRINWDRFEELMRAWETEQERQKAIENEEDFEESPVLPEQGVDLVEQALCSERAGDMSSGDCSNTETTADLTPEKRKEKTSENCGEAAFASGGSFSEMSSDLRSLTPSEWDLPEQEEDKIYKHPMTYRLYELNCKKPYPEKVIEILNQPIIVTDENGEEQTYPSLMELYDSEEGFDRYFEEQVRVVETYKEEKRPFNIVFFVDRLTHITSTNLKVSGWLVWKDRPHQDLARDFGRYAPSRRVPTNISTKL